MKKQTVDLDDWPGWQPTVFHLPNAVFDMQVPSLTLMGLVVHISGNTFHLRHQNSGALLAKAVNPTALRDLAVYLMGYVDFTAFDSPMGYHNLCPNLPVILVAAAPTFGAQATIVDKNTQTDEAAHKAVAHKNRGVAA